LGKKVKQMRKPEDNDNILPFKRPQAPVGKRAADNLQWISELDSMASVRRAIAADPAVEGALKEIARGSLQSLVRKAIEQ
jgi:hypothetical protein